MRIEQHFNVAHPRARVWDYFGQLEAVTRCMPGAGLTEPPAGNHIKFKLEVKLGPIVAAFVGEADVERDAATSSGIIRGSGRDNRSGSRAKGEVVYHLSEDDGGPHTRVDISVDFSLAGRLAQFGRAGIVNDLTARLTAQFARNLEAALGAMGAAADGPGALPPAPPTPDPQPALNAGALIWSVLWRRLVSFLRSLGRAR